MVVVVAAPSPPSAGLGDGPAGLARGSPPAHRPVIGLLSDQRGEGTGEGTGGGHERRIGLRVWHRPRQRGSLSKLRRKAAKCPDPKGAGSPGLAPPSFPPQLSGRRSPRPGRIVVAVRHLGSPKVPSESPTNGRGNYLSGLFQVFGSLPHGSAPSLLPPRLAPGVVFRSLSSELAPPTVTSARGGRGGRLRGESRPHNREAGARARVTGARGVTRETAIARADTALPG